MGIILLCTYLYSKSTTINSIYLFSNSSNIHTDDTKFDIKKNNKNKFIAHRGLSTEAPENTIPAFDLAGAKGFWGSECDIFTSSDEQFILMHDDTVDRTTDGKGQVSDLTLREIKRLNIVSLDRKVFHPKVNVPTLQEYLISCNKYDVVPVIEIKKISSASSYAKFIKILKDNGALKKAYVMSFDKDILLKLRQASSEIKLGMLFGYDINFAKELKNSFFALRYDSITPEMLKEGKANGFEFMAWTVNDANKAKELLNIGVDYIITDTAFSESFEN
jgi:glycerophosphoryl diester phosphodiesterase